MTIKKYIPDFVTSLNLAAGTAGLVFTFNSRFDIAFYCMLAAAVFDFLDGFLARLLGAYSDYGKELDSLCDVVSFGVLPSVMLYYLMRVSMFGQMWLCWTPLLIAVFSALRLAKFNVDDAQGDYFLGLATPACALLCGSLTYFTCFNPASFLAVWTAGPVFIPLLSVCLCVLLVCRLPMFSLKFRKDDAPALKTKRFTYLVLVIVSILVCVFFGLNWSMAVLLSILCYILKNIVYALFKI